jgi:hypothetical protein
MNAPIKPFPLSLFPVTQVQIRALLEDADELARAGHQAWADRLVSEARKRAAELRESIGGIA